MDGRNDLEFAKAVDEFERFEEFEGFEDFDSVGKVEVQSFPEEQEVGGTGGFGISSMAAYMSL